MTTTLRPWAFRQYIQDTDHCFRAKEVTFLDKDADHYLRGIKLSMPGPSNLHSTEVGACTTTSPTSMDEVLKAIIRRPRSPPTYIPNSPTDPKILMAP